MGMKGGVHGHEGGGASVHLVHLSPTAVRALVSYAELHMMCMLGIGDDHTTGRARSRGVPWAYLSAVGPESDDGHVLGLAELPGGGKSTTTERTVSRGEEGGREGTEEGRTGGRNRIMDMFLASRS